MANKNPVIDENTIFADDYVIDGDSRLWPKMCFRYISWLSPTCLLSYKIGIPFALLFLVLSGPGGIAGLPAVIGVLLIWTLCCWRMSMLHWAEALHYGGWVNCVDEKGMGEILRSGFLINRSTGRVYNREEEPFVRKYRREHPNWWRSDKHKNPAIPYDDKLHFHYITDVSPGFWVTEREWNEIVKLYEKYAGVYAYYNGGSKYHLRKAISDFAKEDGYDYETVKSI